MREMDEEGRQNDKGWTAEGVRGRRPDGPLALSQTVATGPGTNLDQESRERRERKRTEPRYALNPPLPLAREYPFFSPPRAFLYSSFPPRFVAPIINISQSPRLTARSAHRCCRCFFFFFFFLILFFLVLFFFLARHPRPAHPACIVADYK